jgi:predicted amidohydrolase
MPSNLVLPDKAQKAVPVMAMMNKYFVLCCNRIGTEKDLTFTGGSLIADPEGKVLCNSPPDREDFRSVTIDPSLTIDKWMTPTNHVFNDRRPELYDLT